MGDLARIRKHMDLGQHFRITGIALKNWLLAQTLDSLAVGFPWLIGLYLLKIPLAPLWALLAAFLQLFHIWVRCSECLDPSWPQLSDGPTGNIPYTCSCCTPESP